MAGFGTGRRLRMSVLFVAALAFGACGVVNNMTGISLAKELHGTGEAAEAVILDIWDTGMTLGNDPVVGFILEVHPAQGEAYQAKTKLVIPRLDVPRVQPGRTVAVRIDPHDRSRVALDIYEFK